MVCDNGYSLRLLMNLTRPQQNARHHLLPLPHTLQYRTYHGNGQRLVVLAAHQTSDFGESEWIHFTGSGYCYVPMRGHTRFCGLNAWGCQNVPSSGRHTHPALWRQSHSLDASAECLPGLPTFDW